MSIRSALVIGGGISGPVTATALHMAGIDVTVCEAYPGPAYGIGTNLALAPNGMAALEIVGAADAVRAAALPIRSSVMSIGATAVTLPTLTEIEPLRLVDRPVLHQVLHDNAVAAGVTFEYNRKLIDVEEHAGGVTALFADGSSATADVLIGTDGIHSTVRTLIDPKAPGPTYLRMLGFGAISDCSLDVAPDSMTFAFGKRAYYLYWALPDGRVGWGANLPREQYFSLSQARTVPVEEWLSILRDTYSDDIPGAELARNTTAGELLVGGALQIMPRVPHWYRGRMVLVGDAIHAPSNTSGQGASLAIESGIELARCLRDIDDPAQAFATYEALRRPRVEAVAARVKRVNHTKAAGPIVRRTMQLVMPIAFKRMNPEKAFGHEMRFRIDWDATVRPVALSA